MANLTEEQLFDRREKSRIRMHRWYVSLTADQKEQLNKKAREFYANASEEQLAKRRARNRRWYCTHPHIIHLKNRKPTQRFSFARSHARRSGRDWNIPFAEFAELISHRCHYCDGLLPESGCGLDRMDNAKGYVVGNVVPCCHSCNKIKRDLLTYEEMVAAMATVRHIRLQKSGVQQLG